METSWSPSCSLGISERGVLSEGKRSDDGKTIYWFSEKNAEYQYNYSSDSYYWITFFV